MIDAPIFWALFAATVAAALAVDMGLFGRFSKHLQKSDMSTKRALIWSVVWIAAGLSFGAFVYANMGADKGIEYITGYAIEKSLSIDNMFVFLLIFGSLAIPIKYQHRVLSVGIISAIGMRIAIILAFMSVLESMHWIIYAFGAFLIFTAIKMLAQRNKHQEVNPDRNMAIRLIRKIMPVSTELHGGKFLTRKNGILTATGLLAALAMIEMSDLVFAVDSIPAIMAISTDSMIIITSNVFALLGLRSLYFLIAGALEKLRYLKPALVALLMYIGAKIMISGIYKIDALTSLMVVGGILGAAVLLSLVDKDKIKHVLAELAPAKTVREWGQK